MNKRKFKFLSWNVRGLNDTVKREIIKQALIMHKPDLICLQEIKLAQTDSRLLSQIIENQYMLFLTIDATNTSGLVLLMWKPRVFSPTNHSTTTFIIAVNLRIMLDVSNITITGVYEPSIGTDRSSFLDELIHVKLQHHIPRIVCGDFNLTLSPLNRSNRRSQS
jgi:exonuclease III